MAMIVGESLLNLMGPPVGTVYRLRPHHSPALFMRDLPCAICVRGVMAMYGVGDWSGAFLDFRHYLCAGGWQAESP